VNEIYHYCRLDYLFLTSQGCIHRCFEPGRYTVDGQCTTKDTPDDDYNIWEVDVIFEKDSDVYLSENNNYGIVSSEDRPSQINDIQ